jgi:uncharacterized membrane protein YhaH (DUF805 family)
MMKLSDLWTTRGGISRRDYMCWGILLMALKYGFDLFASEMIFGKPWSISYYFYRPQQDLKLQTDAGGFLLPMVVLGLPFAWAGIILTLKRLRSAGLPRLLTLLFFVPVLNVLFFILLSVAPDRPGTPITTSRPVLGRLQRWMPDNPWVSALLSVLLTTAFGVALTQLGEEILQQYAMSLFVLSPFTLGLVASLVHGAKRPRRFSECVTVTLVSVLLVGVALLCLAFEGVICLLMALPLALPLALLGCSVGFLIQRDDRPRAGIPPVISTMAIALPLIMLLDRASDPRPSLFAVHSSVEIAATPETVWHNVIQFNELPPPTERIFHTGIAYPIRARIYGHGPGAVRYCMFSTGSFVEPIEVWDEPHLLRFGVTQNPPPMQEWSPYPNLQTPHLDGYFVSEHGQFLLTALPNGHTLLEGTTWYRDNLWPETYWRYWSDYIIHRIHLRVLNFIKSQSEKEVAAA